MFLTCVLKFCYIGDELYVRMTQGDFSTSRIYTVTDLVGKNILLYFSAHWCPPCRAFLPKLVDAYHKIKAKDDAFEVIFISSDRDQASFDEFFSGMPWLALPFGDPRKASLSRTFKVHGIPLLVAIGHWTKEARDIIMTHGADAYPFTDERLKEIEAQIEELAKGWPEKLELGKGVSKGVPFPLLFSSSSSFFFFFFFEERVPFPLPELFVCIVSL